MLSASNRYGVYVSIEHNVGADVVIVKIVIVLARVLRRRERAELREIGAF